MHPYIQQFIQSLKQTTLLEYIAVAFGIISVLLSRIENIGVYPTGIINTTLFTYLSFNGGLYAEAAVNIYYTIMSILGWLWWAQKQEGKKRINIQYSNKKEKYTAIVFFTTSWVGLYLTLHHFTNSTVPLADAFASATAYTAMWLMAKKKIEHWLWWVITNLASIPLYFIKGYTFTSFQFILFLILAILGWIEWKKIYHLSQQNTHTTSLNNHHPL